MYDLIQRFKCPHAEYRSNPFWSWNDKLDPEGFAYQISEMKIQGMGGFFMHFREGLETWCETAGLKFTGYMNQENDFWQGIRIKGSLMPHHIYQYNGNRYIVRKD